MLLGVLGSVAHVAVAQSTAAGDVLLRAGRVAEAESLFYAAAAAAPRDPDARLALGRYLAARGALRVGAVLLEEARVFGADSALIARELAPVYTRLGDYQALASLPRSPLTGPQRERAMWLRDHPPAVIGADSVMVAFTPSAGGATIGTFVAIFGGDSVTVAVEADLAGWVVDPRFAARAGMQLFGERRPVVGQSVGITRLRVGALSVTGVPVDFAADVPEQSVTARPVTVRVGLDALGAFAPTFDTVAGVLILRRDGRVQRAPGRRAPTLTLGERVYVVTAGRLALLGSEPGRALLSTARRWMFDRRRGEIAVER